MYSQIDFKTKKELKEAIKSGKKVSIYSPGIGTPKADGREYLEGPHYPKPHTWYASVLMEGGYIKKVIS
ncbi:MAG: hypothetical protein PHC68_00655 [Syntrophorhabdaceae bacterium]|nr:hypothetical protein [Syntrophorhabdaceae bacterium]